MCEGEIITFEMTKEEANKLKYVSMLSREDENYYGIRIYD